MLLRAGLLCVIDYRRGFGGLGRAARFPFQESGVAVDLAEVFMYGEDKDKEFINNPCEEVSQRQYCKAGGEGNKQHIQSEEAYEAN